MPKDSDLPVAAPNPAVGPVKLADLLGWASAGLGAPMLFTRQRFLHAIGVRPDRAAQRTTLAVGIREFLAFGTIVIMRHRRVGAWSRVGGDLIDLSLLGVAYRTRRELPERLLGFAGFVGGILAADLFTATQLSRAEGVGMTDGSSSSGVGARPEPTDGPTHIRTAVTIRGSEEEIKQRFTDFDWSAFDAAELLQSEQVRFSKAPGDRGVELHLDLDSPAPGGAIGAAALKLAGQSPQQKTDEELRRFKALIETGVEVRSDKTPEGHSALRQILQRPGQPIEGKA